MLTAVTATIGVLCLIGALLLATIGRMQWPRVIVALTLTGAAGLLNSTIGPPIHQALTTADRWVGQFFGRWTGTAVFGVVSIVVLAIAAFRVHQKRYDTRTLMAVAAVPPTVTLIPGMLGSIATTVVGFVPWVVGGVVSFLLFRHW